MQMDAASAADFPRHGAEGGFAVCASGGGFGGDHVVQCGAVAVHFLVGGFAGVGGESADGGSVLGGDDEHVAGEIEAREGFRGGEGSFGDG